MCILGFLPSLGLEAFCSAGSQCQPSLPEPPNWAQPGPPTACCPTAPSPHLLSPPDKYSGPSSIVAQGREHTAFAVLDGP